MSGTTGISGAALLDAEKTDVRRFCGYPVIGTAATGENSWRFFQDFGQFEWRIANVSPTETAQIRVYLSQLYPLESGIVGAAANLDTEQAGPWRRNGREVEDRLALYDVWRRRLCGFLGVLPGPDLVGEARIVV